MAKRKTVLPHGEHSLKRTNAPVLRQRQKITKNKVNEPVKRSKPVQKKGRGRYGTAVYKPEYAGQAQRLAQSGRTLTEIAQYFSISTDLMRRWMKQHPDFGRGVGYGKVDLQMKSVNSLEKLISGAVETKKTFKKDESGEMVETGETVHQMKPDIESIKFYLMAHDPQQWAVGGLGGESNMTLVASLALVDAVMKRIPQTERKALPPPPPEFPPETYSESSVILEVGRNDESRIYPEAT